MLTPYPTAAEASEALGVVGGYATGNSDGYTTAHVVHACWTAFGYGQSQLSPDDVLVPAGDFDTRAAFAAHFDAARLGDGTLLKSIPWGTVLPILLKLLGGLAGA